MEANSLGKKIRKARLSARLTQRELAAKIGLKSKMTISRFENGGRCPNFDVVMRVAAATGCPLEWFAESDSEDRNPVRKPDEIELLELFSHLSLDGREHLLKCLHAIFAAEKYWGFCVGVHPVADEA